MPVTDVQLRVLETSHTAGSDARLADTRTEASAGQYTELAENQIWRMAGDHRWRIIVCQRGMVWVTQSCDLRDYVLHAGQMCLITQPGLVLVQALREACVQITPAPNRTPYTGDFADAIFA